jgi:hypothetical protein
MEGCADLNSCHGPTFGRIQVIARIRSTTLQTEPASIESTLCRVCRDFKRHSIDFDIFRHIHLNFYDRTYQGVDDEPFGCPRAGKTSCPRISKWGMDDDPFGWPRAGHSSFPRMAYHGVEELPWSCPRAGTTSVPRISKCGADELPLGCPLAGRSSAFIVFLSRLGSGDGERKTLLTRQIAIEPLPAFVLFRPCAANQPLMYSPAHEESLRLRCLR